MENNKIFNEDPLEFSKSDDEKSSLSDSNIEKKKRRHRKVHSNASSQLDVIVSLSDSLTSSGSSLVVDSDDAISKVKRHHHHKKHHSKHREHKKIVRSKSDVADIVNEKLNELEIGSDSGVKATKKEKKKRHNHRKSRNVKVEELIDEETNIEVPHPELLQDISPGIMSKIPFLNETLPNIVTFKDFTKIRLIGKGDVGKVYLVQRNGTQEYYAMKVLPKQRMINRNKVKRCYTEKEILETARHPFIITLFWSFQSSNCLYFIMEYCSGGELFNTLRKQPGKCIPEESARFYAAEVLLALEYLHLLGFIYRDLKPENILLLSSGHIVLTDFDLSKQATSHATARVLKTMFGKDKLVIDPGIVTNSFVGTEEYIAPEVITGYGHTSSVDFWTFGILLYEMMYGATPFHGQTRDKTFKQILHGNIHFPENHRFVISKNAKDLIKKLLSGDPNRRLGSTNGVHDVKSHLFFKGINFSLIRNITPPFIPELSDPIDTRNFPVIKDDGEILALEKVAEIITQDVNDPFSNFDVGPIRSPTKFS